MKVCYCDESGTGDEPIAVMAGVVVDAQRMHLTKDDWAELLDALSDIAGRMISEFHTRVFYAGNGVWRGIDGPKRARIITRILEWLADRKHHVVYSSVVKEQYFKSLKRGDVPGELNTPWRFLGFHLILALQKCHRAKEKNKGQTLFIFDNEERERLRFTDLIDQPPSWSDSYYNRRKEKALDQVVDVPYFADSDDVGLIQLADFLAFLLRRYAEIKEGKSHPRYADEDEKVTAWANSISERCVGRSFIYPATGRCQCADLFYVHAPESLRLLA